MTSAEVKKMYDDGKIEQLFKDYKKYFDLIDSWAMKMIDGDLMSEYDLKYAMQQINGCQTKLNTIAGALESMIIEYENDYYLQEEKKFKNLRIQDKDHCKAVARKKVSDIRRYASDFSRYVNSAQNAVVTAQSLLKRQTIEKSNKGIDFTGDTSNIQDSTDATKKWYE